MTVFFEKPFWVGVFERSINGKLSTCKIVFGPEPKDYDVYAYVLTAWYNLEFEKPTEFEPKEYVQKNPKRVKREISKQLQSRGISTKAQIAIQKDREQNKAARKKRQHVEKEAKKEYAFELKQNKQKEKRRGK